MVVCLAASVQPPRVLGFIQTATSSKRSHLGLELRSGSPSFGVQNSCVLIDRRGFRPHVSHILVATPVDTIPRQFKRLVVVALLTVTVHVFRPLNKGQLREPFQRELHM